MAEHEAQDYPAAKSNLSMLVGPAEAAKLAEPLRAKKAITHNAAKDLLRASGLPLLPSEGSEVGRQP